MFLFLTVVQALVAAALVAVVLVQKSEGGGLVVGVSPGGVMSARGAADFLTRATAILATAFVVLSIVLAALAVSSTSTRKIDDSLDRKVVPASQPQAPADPLAGNNAGTPAQAPAQAPAPAGNSNDPLSGR